MKIADVRSNEKYCFSCRLNESLIHNHTIIMHKEYFHSWTYSYLFLRFIDHLNE